LAASSRGNVITLDDSTYEYYAVNSPRPYSLVVFFTAAHPKFKCSICKSLDKNLQAVAQAYKSKYDNSEEKQNEVFFLRADYESSQRVFGKYDITSVPLVFHIPPDFGGEDDTSGLDEDGDSVDNHKNSYHIMHREKFQVPATVDVDSIADFLRDRTGASVTIERSMIMAYFWLAVFFGAVLVAIPSVMSSLDSFWLPLMRNKSLWGVISGAIYTCAISGMIFDIIRSPPMYYANPQNGQIMFFYPQSGNQFVVEGFVIGFLNVCCALSLVFLGVVAPKFKSEEHRTMAVIGGIIFFIMCFWQIRNLYRMKNRWYGSAM
jgi:hypothetical protein